MATWRQGSDINNPRDTPHFVDINRINQERDTERSKQLAIMMYGWAVEKQEVRSQSERCEEISAKQSYMYQYGLGIYLNYKC